MKFGVLGTVMSSVLTLAVLGCGASVDPTGTELFSWERRTLPQ